MMHQPFPPANSIQPSAGRVDGQFDQGEVLYVEVHTRERRKTHDNPWHYAIDANPTPSIVGACPFQRISK
jgi:hypothetical protein